MSSIDEVLTKVELKEIKDSLKASAFPGRTGMGYAGGLTKLEWVTTQLLSGRLPNSGPDKDIRYYVDLAKLVIEACAKETK